MAKLAADSVDDFIAKAAKKWGKGRAGETHPKPAWTYGGFTKEGQVLKLVFSFDSTIEYAEDGGGKADAENKKAIKLVAKLAKEHEENHQTYYEKAFKAWKPQDQADGIMEQVFDSKSAAVKAMEAKFAELQKELLAACLELHRKEGIIYVELEKDGSYSVYTKPAGPTGCK